MGLKNKIISAVAGATLLGGGITSVVKHNEGDNKLPDGAHIAYQDSAGVWTYCYGETKGAYKGLRVSQGVCDKQLVLSVQAHAEALTGLPDDIPDVVILGSIDMTYNIGVYGFKNSTQKKHLMNKDYKRAGQAVLAWRYITLPNGTKYDCSQLVNGKPNKVCWGLWERRQWQAKAIGNQYDSVESAINALMKGQEI